jgi:hypothetical protein
MIQEKETKEGKNLLSWGVRLLDSGGMVLNLKSLEDGRN